MNPTTIVVGADKVAIPVQHKNVCWIGVVGVAEKPAAIDKIDVFFIGC